MMGCPSRIRQSSGTLSMGQKSGRSSGNTNPDISGIGGSSSSGAGGRPAMMSRGDSVGCKGMLPMAYGSSGTGQMESYSRRVKVPGTCGCTGCVSSHLKCWSRAVGGTSRYSVPDRSRFVLLGIGKSWRGVGSFSECDLCDLPCERTVTMEGHNVQDLLTIFLA